jgi:hypothetical protein
LQFLKANQISTIFPFSIHNSAKVIHSAVNNQENDSVAHWKIQDDSVLAHLTQVLQQL